MAERTGHAPAVLLVEDEEDVRAVLAQALADAGLTVAEAPGQHDAECLMAVDAGWHFDLLITDLGLADGDGAALIDAAALQGLPSIAITGYHDRVPGGPPVGPRALLEKPFRLDHFIGTVQQALADSDRS